MKEEKFYNTIWQRKSDNNLASISDGREFEALKVLGTGEVLLDIGCGNGSLAAWTEGKFDQVIGLDVSMTGLRYTSGKKMAAIQANLNRGAIPLQDNSVDCVVCLDVIEHLFDPFHLAGEVWRVLKADGEFVVTTPNTRFIRHIADLLFRGVSPKTNLDTEGYDGGHLHYFTFADLKRILIQSNFGIMEQRGFSKRFYRSIKLYVFFVLSRLWEKAPAREYFCQGILIRAKKKAVAALSS